MRIKAGIFNLTPPAPPDDDGGYLRWHLLDHLPEQFQLPGIQQATRWIADGSYPTARIAADDDLDVGNVVSYLVGDPVQQTLDDFMELGRRLAEIGRFPVARPSLQLRMLALLRWRASPAAAVSAEVLPWRPHRGVLFVVEEPSGDGRPDEWLGWLEREHHPSLLGVPGVAGVWLYGSTTTWNLPARAQGSPQYVSVVYLDDDPLAVTTSLVPLVEARWASGAVRPRFVGPLRSMIEWEAWPAERGGGRESNPPDGGHPSHPL